MLRTTVTKGDVLASKYRVDGVLSSGGMGMVVAATHLQLGRRVAIKLLLPNAVGNSQAVARLLREARAVAMLKSEHVAQVLDVGTLAEGQPYIVMEFLDGKELAQVLQEKGKLPIELAVGYVLQACEAVAEAHGVGIVHRDLKPSNLFLTTTAFGLPLVKVLDFGISKVAGVDEKLMVTAATQIIGSPLYMSPEQMTCMQLVDARADIWGMATILFELLAGKPVWRGKTLAEIHASILKEAPPALSEYRSDVPRELEQIILRCLDKNRDQRPSTIAALARAIAPFASREAQVTASRIRSVVPSPPSENSLEALNFFPAETGAPACASQQTDGLGSPGTSGARMSLGDKQAGLGRIAVLASGACIVGFMAWLAFGRAASVGVSQHTSASTFAVVSSSPAATISAFASPPSPSASVLSHAASASTPTPAQSRPIGGANTARKAAAPVAAPAKPDAGRAKEIPELGDRW